MQLPSPPTSELVSLDISETASLDLLSCNVVDQERLSISPLRSPKRKQANCELRHSRFQSTTTGFQTASPLHPSQNAFSQLTTSWSPSPPISTASTSQFSTSSTTLNSYLEEPRSQSRTEFSFQLPGPTNCGQLLDIRPVDLALCPPTCTQPVFPVTDLDRGSSLRFSKNL